MHPRVINGDRWIAERLAFLRGLLETELSTDERAAVEQEIAALSEERGLLVAGRQAPRFLRRFRRRP